MGRKLNIGCGDKPLDGWENLDKKLGGEAFPLRSNEGQPYPDNTFDEVRASHLLEHFAHEEVTTVLGEWVRVLKPGGKLKLAVPDFDYIAQGYLAGKQEPFARFLMGGQTDPTDFHKTVFNRERLEAVMKMCGLSGVSTWKSEIDDCASFPVSLNLEGTKSAGFDELSKPFPKVKIAAVMSMPRLAFADNMFCAHQVFPPLGVGFERVTGAYWGQCLERIMQSHLDDGTDWICTLDYDTIFNSEIFHRLCVLMAEHPEVDALAPLQTKREEDIPLHQFRPKANGELLTLEDLSQPLTPSWTAHFGLTLFRVSALKKMPHPWFIDRPNPKGEWGEGKTDADIMFWEKFNDAGNMLYTASQISIGHLQLTASWVGKDLQTIHQYVDDWQKNGIPAEARQ